MKSNYKQLGSYIRVVDKRNKDLEVDLLLGVSVRKVFIPSVANTVGTDFKKYKLVEKKQFTYIPDTSRRGDKMGIAMLEKYDIALVSQAYTVFEVIDHNVLDPEYLMMWFRRPEFDRYARFKSHGSVREIFDWDEMCEIELPVPSIEKQREIVKEYNTIVNRISLNEELNLKLEETAQSLYKHWFVDFEFPNEEGKPYKSCGGEMVYDKELNVDIPMGWKSKNLGEFIESFSRKHDFKKDELIFFNTSDILEGEFLHEQYSPVNKMPGQAKKSIQKNDILYSEIRPKNKRYALVRLDAEDYVVSTKLMVLRRKTTDLEVLRLYYFLTEDSFVFEINQSAEGKSGTFPQITFEEDIENKKIIIASSEVEKEWHDFLKVFYDQLHLKKDEIKVLEKTRTIVLSRLSKLKAVT